MIVALIYLSVEFSVRQAQIKVVRKCDLAHFTHKVYIRDGEAYMVINLQLLCLW